uniref:RING-type E3 ubiquitin transferase n=1 Tax=Fagus sylvatica TaxID=28930 RepID=A0A2N9I394_FAGSY
MAMYSVIHNRKLLLLSDYAPFPIPSLPPQPPTTAPPTLTPLALVFLSLIALILLLALLYGIFTMCSAFCKCHSNSHDLAEQDSQPSSNGLQSGLDPKFIQDFLSNLQSAGVDPMTIQLFQMPLYDYDHGLHAMQSEYCTICDSDFQDNEAVKAIPFCNHMFHPDCLETWLSSNVTCPECGTTRFF